MNAHKNNSGLVDFAKKVGVICGAVIAAGTVVQWVGGFLWGYATRPIIDKMDSLQVSVREERIARQRGDSLIVEQIARLGEATLLPAGSNVRERAMDDVINAPAELMKQQVKK